MVRSVRRRAVRARPPKDSKVRKAVLAYIALKAQGFQLAEIAERLGLAKTTVQTYVKRAHAAGWINIHNFDDPEDKLEVVLKSKAVTNLNSLLSETDDDGRLSARAGNVSLEVAKGTGLLKQHQVVKNDGAQMSGFALKVTVEMPPAGNVPIVTPGSIGGTPAFNAEIIEGELHG